MAARVVFHGRLAENLRFGHALLISGKVSKGAKRFFTIVSSENLTTDGSSNIGLSILVDFYKDIITLKQFFNNEWCNKESLSCDCTKFLNQFNIYIIIAHEKFHISLNEDTTITYKYRLGLTSLNVLEIRGDLEYIRQVDHRQYFPYSWPPIQVVEQRLQFSNDVPMPFKTGHLIVVSANLRGNDKGRLIIHLRNNWDSERQELHLSVRFDTRVIVRNSKTIEEEEHYSFAEEERSRDFPFSNFSKPFKLAIGFAKHGLKFAKDGAFMFSFQYRTLDVLPCIGGLKMFGIDGAVVHVSGVDHVQIEDSFCIGFEKYSKL